MNKKYDIMQKKYAFNNYLYVNAIPDAEIKDANGSVSQALIKSFNGKLKTSLKSQISNRTKLEKKDDDSWILDDTPNHQKYMIEKDEGLHVFNVVPKLICSTCGEKSYEDASKCLFCTNTNLVSPQERFPEIDSSESFPCPACKTTLSVDVIYDEENKCHCGKRIEICNNCQGAGFVKSDRHLTDKEQKLLSSEYFVKEGWRATGIAFIPIAFFIILYFLEFFSPMSMIVFVESIGLLIFAPYILWRIFKPVAIEKELLTSPCMQCGSASGRGRGIS